MQKMLKYYPFWLSLLLHLLLLLNFVVVWTIQPNIKSLEPHPQLYIPSYVYRNEQTQSVPKSTSAQKPIPDKSDSTSIATSNPAPAVNNAAQEKLIRYSKEAPVHLLGDKKINKSLIKLVGQALTAHLIYPKIAEDFRIKGIVYVGFSLHPDGNVTDVRLIKTSGADVLDKAALAGVNAMSPVKRVAEFLQNPKFMIIGINFR